MQELIEFQLWPILVKLLEFNLDGCQKFLILWTFAYYLTV